MPHATRKLVAVSPDVAEFLAVMALLGYFDFCRPSL
jgi:hypothetical protein